MRLKNTTGGELRFSALGFTAPAGYFDVKKELAEQLLRNDAIQKVEAEETAKPERKIKLKENK